MIELCGFVSCFTVCFVFKELSASFENMKKGYKLSNVDGPTYKPFRVRNPSFENEWKEVVQPGETSSVKYIEQELERRA